MQCDRLGQERVSSTTTILASHLHRYIARPRRSACQPSYRFSPASLLRSTFSQPQTQHHKQWPACVPEDPHRGTQDVVASRQRLIFISGRCPLWRTKNTKRAFVFAFTSCLIFFESILAVGSIVVARNLYLTLEISPQVNSHIFTVTYNRYQQLSTITFISIYFIL